MTSIVTAAHCPECNWFGLSRDTEEEAELDARLHHAEFHTDTESDPDRFGHDRDR